MRRIIKRIYYGVLYLDECGAAYISEFRATEDIAVQAHDAFEDKRCHPIKQELYKCLSKESDVTAYRTGQALLMGVGFL